MRFPPSSAVTNLQRLTLESFECVGKNCCSDEQIAIYTSRGGKAGIILVIRECREHFVPLATREAIAPGVHHYRLELRAGREARKPNIGGREARGNKSASKNEEVYWKTVAWRG